MIPAGMFRNIGRAGAANLLRNRTMVGALTGAAYGAVSDNTSVLGGALMGAAGGRYLGAGLKRAAMSGSGLGFRGSLGAYARSFGTGMLRVMRRDKLWANRGINRISSSLKGW